jgi:hypothetical protein
MDIAKAIHAINSSAEFKYSREDFSTLTWLNGTTPISQSDIEAKQVELKAEYDNKQYQRDREIEYPSWQDQLDMQYWDKVNGTSTWQDAVAEVKLDNPKS